MRLAMITGGSKGLGLSLCKQLRVSGWTVVEYSRTAPHAFSVGLDLSLPELVHEEWTEGLTGVEIDDCEELLAISNAATLSPIGPASLKPAAEVLSNLHTNFTSAIVFLSQVTARFQHLPSRKVLAVISSGAAIRPYAGLSLYCAAKAGLESYMRTLELEQRRERHPFLPISVDPGAMDTHMQSVICQATALDFPDVDRFIRRRKEGSLPSADTVATRILDTLARADLSPGRHSVLG